MKHLNHNQLFSLIKKGHLGAFNELYHIYWEKLYLFSKHLTTDQDIAKQIVQDVFIEIWEKRLSLNISNIESYLFQCVKFQIFKHYRQKKFNTVFIEDQFEEYIIEHVTETDSEIIDKINKSIDRLPTKRKEIFKMKQFQEMSISQIALELNISKQTVKNQLTFALQQLRLELKNIFWLLLLILSYY